MRPSSSSLPAKHHGTLVRLYASFAPNKLLGFLKTSDDYPMTEALEECTMRGMVPERIYLLGRMGNTKAALELIMTELVDVEQAVEFCKEHDESELWDDLINYSIDKPAFISVLLNNIGTHIINTTITTINNNTHSNHNHTPAATPQHKAAAHIT